MTRFVAASLLMMLLLGICAIRTSAQSASDEGTLKKLEIDRPQYTGTTDADISFRKRVSSRRVTSIDPLGHVADSTPEETEKAACALRTVDPNVETQPHNSGPRGKNFR